MGNMIEKKIETLEEKFEYNKSIMEVIQKDIDYIQNIEITSLKEMLLASKTDFREMRRTMEKIEKAIKTIEEKQIIIETFKDKNDLLESVLKLLF